MCLIFVYLIIIMTIIINIYIALFFEITQIIYRFKRYLMFFISLDEIFGIIIDGSTEVLIHVNSCIVLKVHFWHG